MYRILSHALPLPSLLDPSDPPSILGPPQHPKTPDLSLWGKISGSGISSVDPLSPSKMETSNEESRFRANDFETHPSSQQ